MNKPAIAAMLVLAAQVGVAQSDYSSPRGTWRGPAQFNFNEGGQRDPEAHTIAQMVIEVGADGQVRGVIPDAGCDIWGLGEAFHVPTVVRLDVTLKGCRDQRFNRRYSGTLGAKASTKEAALTLNSMSAGGLTKKPTHASLGAVLRR